VPEPPLLVTRGIVKEFPGVRALDGVDLEVRPGEVHCLLGQNGAGKSTLVKVLSGAHQPDSGEIVWREDQTPQLTSPTAALRLGIATTYQELGRLLGQSNGMGDLAEQEIPASVTLFSAVVTKENVDPYLPLSFE
jgi:ribose transport system ATP-binding protein